MKLASIRKKISTELFWLKDRFKPESLDRPTNIYQATIQKTGSQWIKEIFSDPKIAAISGLYTYPQHRYEWTEFHLRFPKGTFVPGLYMSYDLYEEIEKPKYYRTFYVLRDPRDVIVSWYYSMLKSHILMGKVGTYRAALSQLDYNDGISYCIDALQLRFAQQRSWMIYGKTDPHVLIVKYEDLIADPFKQFKHLFEHCHIPVPDETLEEVIQKYSFTNMKKKDLEKRSAESAESHYRKGKAEEWREALTEEHLKKFYGITGNLIEVLGYEY